LQHTRAAEAQVDSQDEKLYLKKSGRSHLQAFKTGCFPTVRTPLMFTKGKIHDVRVKDLAKFLDERGWLSEVYRTDELDEALHPVMAYISFTQPGVARGPHEHRDQTDMFCFVGPSDFKVYLWDNRASSPTYRTRQVVYAGENSPRAIVIPPGVAHAYKNIGSTAGMVVNLPNRLYAGPGKKEPVDEIRHEADPGSPFLLD
jgi:dTDP-4-dehydrorhamnose 3,5-epimerase